MKNIFLVCPVRLADATLASEILDYVQELESFGHSVYYPARDTDQTMREIDICRANACAIRWCDEVYVWYMKESQGTHFDMGAAFALAKPIKVVKNETLVEGKCFQRMLIEWEEQGSQMEIKSYVER